MGSIHDTNKIDELIKYENFGGMGTVFNKGHNMHTNLCCYLFCQ